MRLFRPARAEDAAAIARLLLISSDGFAAYAWGLLAKPGEPLEAAGRRRHARTGVPFSGENAAVAEQDGAMVGMAHAVPIGVSDAPSEEPDPVLRPYAELEEPGSLHLAGLAIDAPYRGLGIGSAPMDATEARAEAFGFDRPSTICFAMNTGAYRPYEGRGYVPKDRRALVPHPTLRYDPGDAVLLVKTLG